MAASFEWQFTVLESHLDTFGHVNHATYLELFEQARWEFITERGFGLKEIQQKKMGPVILALTIRYKKELCLRDKITVKSEIQEYRSSVGKINQVMLNEKGEPCAVIELTAGLFDMVGRRLIPPTPEWRHAMGMEPNPKK
jgi:thioesterase-3